MLSSALLEISNPCAGDYIDLTGFLKLIRFKLLSLLKRLIYKRVTIKVIDSIIILSSAITKHFNRHLIRLQKGLYY